MTSRTSWADLKTTSRISERLALSNVSYSLKHARYYTQDHDEMNKLFRFPQVDDFRKALYVIIDRMKRYFVDYLYSIK